MLNNKHSQLLAYHCKALLKNDFPLSNFRCLSRNLFNAQRCFNIIPDSKTVQKEIIQGLYADYRSKLSSYGTAQYSILSWLLIATVTMSITALFLVAGCLFAWRKVQCVTGILLSLSKFFSYRLMKVSCILVRFDVLHHDYDVIHYLRWRTAGAGE